ncbi:MAG: ERF family protein [Patescibacteria group bacterium]|nr:ERF family protein [Patescibacteria group bacterium]
MTKTATKTKEAQPDLLGAPQEAPAPKPPAVAKPEKPKRGTASTAIAVHKPQGPQSDIALMIEAIRDPSFDPAKAKALCDLRDHEEDRALQRMKLQAEIDFNEALAAVKKRLPAVVGPDRESDKNKYASLEKVSRTMDPIIAEHGFTISYGMAESSLDGYARITARLSRGLHSRDYFVDFPSGAHKSPTGKELMTPVQGVGVLISYARRYLKLMIFDVVIGNEDIDGGASMAGLITEKQAEQILSLCAEKGIDQAKFQRAFRVPRVDALPAVRFEDVLARLKTAPAQQKQKADDEEAEG